MQRGKLARKQRQLFLRDAPQRKRLLAFGFSSAGIRDALLSPLASLVRNDRLREEPLGPEHGAGVIKVLSVERSLGCFSIGGYGLVFERRHGASWF